MRRYDPDEDPAPEAWLALDEGEQLDLVARWHADNPAPALHPPNTNPRVHANLHAVVERQLAAGDPPGVARNVARIMADGLRRHAALHAVMRILVEHMHAALAAGRPFDTEAYEAALDRLRPEDAIPVEGLAWMDAAEDAGPDAGNRAARRARRKKNR